MILAYVEDSVSHRHETTSSEQSSEMGVMFNLMGCIMHERGEGPTVRALRPLGVPVILPL